MIDPSVPLAVPTAPLAPVPAHRDPRTIAAASTGLSRLGELCPSLVVAIALTDDGFEVVRHPARAATDERLASMASSLQALSEAIVRELKLGEPGYVILDASAGHVLLRRVPGQRIVLAAVFDSDESVGKAISVSRTISAEIAAAL